MHVHSSGSCEGAAAARPVPREMVVFAELRRRVLAGVYAKGERLPPLAAVGEEFGVSEQVAQRAVARLRELGLLCTVPTRGTWVVETITDRARMRTAFDAARSGVFLDDMFAPDAGPLVEFPSTWIARLLDESDERLT
jgi:GntR family transcriptional regulator